VGRAIQHRWYVLLGSCVFLLIGALAASHLKSQFFPEDVQYWFYLDIWLPNDVPLSATNDTAVRAEQVVRKVIEGAPENGSKEKGTDLLTSVTTFIGAADRGSGFPSLPKQPRPTMRRSLCRCATRKPLQS
jgi:multidrug efflux pump subunit AcrB